MPMLLAKLVTTKFIGLLGRRLAVSKCLAVRGLHTKRRLDWLSTWASRKLQTMTISWLDRNKNEPCPALYELLAELPDNSQIS